MRKYFSCCDYCEKQSEDTNEEKGWIRFDKLGALRISKGYDGRAKKNREPIIISYHAKEDDTLEFCSISCLSAFIRYIKKGITIN